MPTDLPALADLTPAQLREQWTALGLRGDPPHFRQALVRGLAWHAQQQSRGGLDADTRRLLRAAVRNAPAPASKQKTPTQCRRKHDPVPLPEGATLMRTWRGRRHEVTVLDGGKRYRYRGTEYASLSEIAREITGARWSGPRFFGLRKLGQSA